MIDRWHSERYRMDGQVMLIYAAKCQSPPDPISHLYTTITICRPHLLLNAKCYSVFSIKGITRVHSHVDSKACQTTIWVALHLQSRTGCSSTLSYSYFTPEISGHLQLWSHFEYGSYDDRSSLSPPSISFLSPLRLLWKCRASSWRLLIFQTA